MKKYTILCTFLLATSMVPSLAFSIEPPKLIPAKEGSASHPSSEPAGFVDPYLYTSEYDNVYAPQPKHLFTANSEGLYMNFFVRKGTSGQITCTFDLSNAIRHEHYTWSKPWTLPAGVWRLPVAWDEIPIQDLRDGGWRLQGTCVEGSQTYTSPESWMFYVKPE